MSLSSEQIELILKITGAESVEEAIAKMTRLSGAAEAVGHTYAMADQKGDQFAITTRDVSHALDAQTAAAVEATMRQKALNTVLGEGAVQGGKFNAFMGEHKFRILEAGRAVQDFAQGGIAGILNNIERLVGGSGALAGILTAVGVAAYVAWPYIKKWADEIGAAGEKFQAPIKETEKLTEAIKKNRKEMEDLKEKTSLTYFEMVKYAELLGKTTKMEEEQAVARAARLVAPGSSKADQARAGAVKETIAERFGSSQELIDAIMETGRGKNMGLQRVEELLAGAQKGFAADVGGLGDVFPTFKEAYTPRSPEVQKQNKLAQENLKKEGEMLEARKKSMEQMEKMWDAEAKEAGKDEFKESHKGFRQFVHEMNLAKQERLKREREGKADARDVTREKQRQLRREQEDVMDASKRNNDLIIDNARAGGANGALLRQMRDQSDMLLKNLKRQQEDRMQALMQGNEA